MSIQARAPNRSQDAAATVAASSNAVGKIPPSCVVVVAEHAAKAGDSRSYGEPQSSGSWGRPAVRCRDCSWSVSAGRPPERREDRKAARQYYTAKASLGVLDRSGVRLSLTPGSRADRQQRLAGRPRTVPPRLARLVGWRVRRSRARSCGATGRTDRPGRPGLKQPVRSPRARHCRGLFQGAVPGGVSPVGP